MDCEAYGNPANFSYYYKELKKINLVRSLQKSGYDTSDIYSENPMDEGHFTINEKFKKLSTEDIINKLKGNLAELEDKYVINAVIKEGSAYDGVRDLIGILEKSPEVGIRL
jgi:hypothetical protein